MGRFMRLRGLDGAPTGFYPARASFAEWGVSCGCAGLAGSRRALRSPARVFDKCVCTCLDGSCLRDRHGGISVRARLGCVASRAVARVSMGAAFATDAAEYRSARVADVWSMGACMRGSRRISRAVCAYEKRIALLATVFVRDLSGFTCGACLIASPLAKTSESAGKARASLRRGLEDLSLASASHAVQRSAHGRANDSVRIRCPYCEPSRMVITEAIVLRVVIVGASSHRCS